MFDRQAAKAVAQASLDGVEAGPGLKYVIVDEWTVERPGCFVFCYQSGRFLSSGSFADQLVGNAPILVDKQSGLAHILGTAHPIEHYIEQFEKAQ